jgi:hypothetical protein
MQRKQISFDSGCYFLLEGQALSQMPKAQHLFARATHRLSATLYTHSPSSLFDCPFKTTGDRSKRWPMWTDQISITDLTCYKSVIF